MIALTRCAQARAVSEGRDFVLPDDVKALAPAALAHRLIPRQGRSNAGVGREVVRRVLDDRHQLLGEADHRALAESHQVVLHLAVVGGAGRSQAARRGEPEAGVAGAGRGGAGHVEVERVVAGGERQAGEDLVAGAAEGGAGGRAEDLRLRRGRRPAGVRGRAWGWRGG